MAHDTSSLFSDFFARFESLVIDQEPAEHFDSILENYTSAEHEGDERLRECFVSISARYRNCLASTGDRPDWSDADNRRAYIYRFFMMHSYMVFDALAKLSEDDASITESWKGKYFLRVCCIGGGPGSDVAGLAKFIQDRKLLPVSRLRCTVIDRYSDWKEDWEQLQTANPGELPTNVTYLSNDLTETVFGLNFSQRHAVQSADIITLVKFFSTIAAFVRSDDDHANCLRKIFRVMKPGALVLYIDNRYYGQDAKFREIASSEGVGDCLFEWHGIVSMSRGRRSANIVCRAISVEPMTSCNVSIVLLRKPFD